jgi:hypothetical protein
LEVVSFVLFAVVSRSGVNEDTRHVGISLAAASSREHDGLGFLWLRVSGDGGVMMMQKS